jgi:hypothetical protein
MQVLHRILSKEMAREVDVLVDSRLRTRRVERVNVTATAEAAHLGQEP